MPGNSPDNHMVSLRERLKAKYKMIDAKETASGDHEGMGSGEAKDEEDGEDEDDSDNDIGLPLIPHDDDSYDQTGGRARIVFEKVPTEDVDALVAVQIAEDVMGGTSNMKDVPSNYATASGGDLETVPRKGLKGSLLLTMILTQVYTVYSNKISRAFYRWKHRTVKTKTELTGKSLSPTREQRKLV